MFEDDDTVFAAVTAGAAGYLLKGSAGADIVAAVRAAAAGQAVFGSALTSRLPGWFGHPPTIHDARLFPELTDRSARSSTEWPPAHQRRDRSQALPLPRPSRTTSPSFSPNFT
jgi:hypothetical protein